MSIRRTAALLFISTATLALGACGGADDVASPGEGNLIVIAPPAPAPSTPTPPPPVAGGPFTGATPAGLTDLGTVNNRRVFGLPSRFTQDTTLQNIPGAVYSIGGPVNVGTDVGGDGNAAGGQAVTLTIQPGTIIIASSGNDYLVVNRGSRLNANGTAAQPIIFTARANLEGTVTDSSQGLWGGIILLGRAPISDCQAGAIGGAANCQQVIEGTTGSFYGGNQPNDNSGSLRFVQIRYSGFAIAPGNELQGLTMGGVGGNTTIDHIQVHNSSDDGVEIFGGRVNTKYLAITGADDDSLDTDLGYQGVNQFIIAVQRDTSNGDSMIEADTGGNEDALPRQNTRVSNATFVQRGTTQGGNAILLRGGTDYALLNSIVTGPQACLDIDGTADSTVRPADAALQDLGPPVFRSVVLSCPTPFRDDASITAAQIATVFGTGSNNNNSTFTSTLANVFVNGANETAVPATNPTTFNTGAGAVNQFTPVTFIGAVQNASDTNFSGWTCNASYVNFGSASQNCTALPANS
jgi:hypothetical protein